MPFVSFQFEQVIVNKVLIVPVRGVMKQEPLSGGRLMIKFIALELISDANE